MNLKEIKQIVTISTGNRKVGQIPSVSFEKNLNSFKSNPIKYFNAINNWLRIKKPKAFRYNVSGDIPNKTYLNQIILTAKNNPDTKFLVFTKRYNMVINNVLFIRHP
jgi:hypothetical protein